VLVLTQYIFTWFESTKARCGQDLVVYILHGSSTDRETLP